MRSYLLPLLWRATNLLVGLLLVVAALAVGLHLAGVLGPLSVVRPGFALTVALRAEALPEVLPWVGLSLLALVLGLGLMSAALVQATPTDRQVVLRGLYSNGRADGGQVTVTMRSVQALVAHAAERTAGVREAVPSVRLGRAGWNVRCRVVLYPAAALPAVTAELQETLRERLEHHTGLPVARIDVAAQLDAIDARRRVR